MAVPHNALLTFAVLLQTALQVDCNAFYIRHYFGKCIEYNADRKALVFADICREKFRWSSGAKLVHSPTNRCVVVNTTVEDSLVSLSSKCGETSTLFQYDGQGRVLRHLISGKCLHPEDGSSEPQSGNAVVIKAKCDAKKNKFYFRPYVYYTIRHFNRKAMVYDEYMQTFWLKDREIPDRYYYENSYNLREVRSGRCVTRVTDKLMLTDDCTSQASVFKLNAYSNLVNTVTVCAHPKSGSSGQLILSSSGCIDSDSVRFIFYDDKDIIKIKAMSQNCHVEDCFASQAYVYVNGVQFYPQWQGVKMQILDMRSGLFEDLHLLNTAVYASLKKLTRTLLNLPPKKIVILASRGKTKLDVNASLALQRWGMSAVYTTAAMQDGYANVLMVVHTGKANNAWDRFAYDTAGGKIEIEVSIPTYLELDGKEDCSEELGIYTGKIPDSRFYASSSYYSWYQSYYNPANPGSNSQTRFSARLHYTGTKAWCSASQAAMSEYIQVDLGRVVFVTGLALQGHPSQSRWVSSYNIRYSIDYENWKYYGKHGENSTTLPGTTWPGRNTRANWFEPILARYVRIIAASRESTQTCLRFELFGCAAKIFNDTDLNDLAMSPLQKYEKNITAYTYAQPSSLAIGISATAKGSAFGKDIDQFHIHKMVGSKTSGNGVTKEDCGRAKIDKNNLGIAKAGTITFDINAENYNQLNVYLNFEVMDSQRANGTIFLITSFESADFVRIHIKQINFTRLSKDRSHLKINVTGREGIVQGENFQVNVSLYHLLSGELRSHSNAYDVKILFYYNAGTLKLESMQAVTEGEWNLVSTTNSTKAGLIRLHTNALSFYNIETVSINFKATFQHILKGNNCNGVFIIDLRYMNNLAMFHGSLTTDVAEQFPYKCKIKEEKSMSLTQRIPELSMVYDHYHGDFIFCVRRKTYLKRNSPHCHMQSHESSAWKGLRQLVSIEGIDVTNRVIYGAHRGGKVYLRGQYPFSGFAQVSDEIWRAAKIKTSMRKAVKVSEISTMSTNPTKESTIGIWAATRKAILKKQGYYWKKMVQL